VSFLVTTSAVWEPSAGGFPALSALPGQFLIKDLALLGIALWIALWTLASTARVTGSPGISLEPGADRLVQKSLVAPALRGEAAKSAGVESCLQLWPPFQAPPAGYLFSSFPTTGTDLARFFLSRTL
jgi:Protein of unknown function, DUF417